MLCENVNMCSKSTMTNSYYGQRSCRARRFFSGPIWSTLQALGASCSKFIAKRTFQRTYEKTTDSIMCEVCVRSDKTKLRDCSL